MSDVNRTNHNDCGSSRRNGTHAGFTVPDYRKKARNSALRAIFGQSFAVRGVCIADCLLFAQYRHKNAAVCPTGSNFNRIYGCDTLFQASNADFNRRRNDLLYVSGSIRICLKK